MNGQHRAIRALLQSMAPRRAIDYIQSFELPEVEERILIECDVRRRPYASLCSAGYSEKVIKDAKRRVYAKIADAINNG